MLYIITDNDHCIENVHCYQQNHQQCYIIRLLKPNIIGSFLPNQVKTKYAFNVI